MIPKFKIKKNKKNKPDFDFSQRSKDFILMACTAELFLFAVFYITINIFGPGDIAAIAASNLKLAILIFTINLLQMPVLLIIYLNHNYSLETHTLKSKHIRGALILLLNALFMPYYWYKFIYQRNKGMGKYAKKQQ